MDIKGAMKLVVSAAIGGLGIVFLIGRREVHDMAARCDLMTETNKMLQDKYEDLQLVNENLREANRWKTELMLKEAIAEIDDDLMRDVEAWAEESKQIVDEMSDEEYKETLAYVEGSEHE